MKGKASDDERSSDFEHRRFMRSHFDDRFKFLDFFEEKLEILDDILGEYPDGCAGELIRTVEGAYMDAMFIQIDALRHTVRTYRNRLHNLKDDLRAPDDIPF